MSNQEKSKKRKRGLETKRQETPKNEQGKMKNIFNWIYGCSYVIKRKHTPKKQKERDKNSKTNEDRKPEKKQRIDEKRKHCNSIVRCCSFLWKQSQKKKKKKKGDSKTRKTTPKKAKKTIRRVKGHFTWPLSPLKKKKTSFCPRKAVGRRTCIFKQKNPEIIVWKLPESGARKKHKMRSECAQNRFKPLEKQAKNKLGADNNSYTWTS